MIKKVNWAIMHERCNGELLEYINLFLGMIETKP